MKPQDGLVLCGEFLWRHETAKGRFVEMGIVRNGVTIAGRNAILNGTMDFSSTYVGLIDSTGFDATTDLSEDDTMSSHAGWSEVTAYSQGARVQWSPSAAAGGVLVNSAALQFTFTSVGTVGGLFVCDSSTKGGTSGVLWSTGAFAAPKVIPIGEVLKVYYRLRALSS